MNKALILLALLLSGNLNTKKMETATFGSGCFWCTEAIFKSLKGVEEVNSGYSGGEDEYPTYHDVSSGETGHAEVVQITFDPKIISYKELLEVFWETHNPTTLNRQGADVGTQYRSAIFYHSEKQKELALHFKDLLNKENVYDIPVVTEITAFDKFYKAEDYHQDYYQNNPTNAYCQFVIVPKLKKFRKIFEDKLK